MHDSLRLRSFIEKYIHVSTPEVYGSSNGGWIKENKNYAPTTPYAVSRAACDLHLHSFNKAYDFPVIFTRAANVYGEGQQLYRIITRAILSARTGRSLKLHGGGRSNYFRAKIVNSKLMRHFSAVFNAPPCSKSSLKTIAWPGFVKTNWAFK